MLPIGEKKDEIISLLKREQVLIVSGETGSGKTTQLPQFCREIGLAEKGKIAITQPRRIAATSIAQRIANEAKTSLGELVGYKIRFSQKLSQNTEIICMTDGILLSELVNNPKMLGYSVIIIDEAHERSLNIDLILGYLRKILPTRPDLKLIISSATMDTSLFSEAFNGAPVIEVSGRMFPVDIIYDDIERGDEGNYIDRAVKSVEYITDISDFGDILVFMPTERDINETVKKLKGRVGAKHFSPKSNVGIGIKDISPKSNADIRAKDVLPLQILPLFSRLTNAEQNRIFQDTDARKIIVSTNIAETSITLPKIKFVVDTGLVRIAKYAPNLRTNRLPVEEISKAEAKQRSGRSGRVSDGTCIRLYSQKDFDGRDEFRLPEIQRLNLAGVILQMLNLNLGDVKNFPFIQAPEPRRIDDAINQLYELGAISQNNVGAYCIRPNENRHLHKQKQGVCNTPLQLTPIGRTMAKFPLEPHISRMIIEAQIMGVSEQVAIIAAGLSIVDPRERPTEQADAADNAHKKFVDIYSDFMSLLKMWSVFHGSFDELKKSQRAMRDYCAEHFLSFNRMREWGDIYEQIADTCKEYDKNFGKVKVDFENLSEAQRWSIHRSICAGLLGNIAVFDSEKNAYSATKNRTVHIFPGSALAGGKKRKSPWIMAQQITETSRVFARTLGPIEPKWIIDFAPNLIKRKYGIPYYDPNIGSVVAEERILFYGLEIAGGQNRFYGNIDPKTARQIFIQSALVEENTTKNYDFLRKNSDLVHKSRTISDGELFNFYDEKISENIASDNQLTGLIKQKKGDGFLTMENKTGKEYPDYLDVGNTRFSLSYRRNFGQDDDGVTIEVPENEMPFVDKKTLEHIKSKKMRIKIIESSGESKLKAFLKQKTIKNYDEILATNVRAGFKPAPTGAIVPAIADDYGYPALTAAADGVHLMWYASPEEAANKHKFGLAKLLELSITDDLMWLKRKLRSSARLFDIVYEAVCFPITGVNTEEEFNEVKKQRLEILKRNERNALDNFAKYKEAVIRVKCRLGAELNKMPKSKILKSIEEDLHIYEQEFNGGYCPLEIFERYPQYIEALICKIDKGLNSPKHFEECEKTMRFYRDKAADFVETADDAFARKFCYLVEELGLKLFAEPKIKAVENISVKKLEKFLEERDSFLAKPNNNLHNRPF